MAKSSVILQDTPHRPGQHKKQWGKIQHSSGIDRIRVYTDTVRPLQRSLDLWSDNSTSMFTNWSPSQPNNYLLQQSCALINLDLWKWYDGECNSRFSFYCFKGEVLNTNTVVSRHYVLMLMFFILLLVVYVCVCNAFNSIAVTNQTILKVKIQSEGNMNSAEIQQQEVLQQESILSTMHIQLQLTLSIFLIWSIFSSWRPTCNQKD